MHADQILEEALRLTVSERARLAASLLDSLDAEADEGVEGARRVEVARRVRELDQGAVETVDWQEARRTILG